MNGKDAREWLITLVALGTIVWFAAGKSDLSSGWVALLGSMLSLPVLALGLRRGNGNGNGDTGKGARSVDKEPDLHAPRSDPSPDPGYGNQHRRVVPA